MRVTQVGRVDGGGGEGIKLCELPLTLWVSPVAWATVQGATRGATLRNLGRVRYR